MNRKLLVVVIVAAVVALIVGVKVGQNLISSEAPAPRAEVIRFKDSVSKVSIAYPASWKLLGVPADENDVALRIKRDDAAGMQMRSTEVGFPTITLARLPTVRKFTDDLLSEDKRVRLLKEPDPVKLGGVPGYRYRYTFGSGATTGAHDHYFLFKDRRMIQIVFEVVPKERLPELRPVFQRIAATFKSESA